MDIFKIDSSICDYYSETKEDEEGANIIVGWCHDNGCECSEIPFDECITKAIEYCKYKDMQIKKLKGKIDDLTILGMDLNQNNEILRKSFLLADKNKDYWREQAEKYHKTIEEIEKIAKQQCVCGVNCQDMKMILQKISEVSK